MIRDMPLKLQGLPREQSSRRQTPDASTWRWRSGWCFRRYAALIKFGGLMMDRRSWSDFGGGDRRRCRDLATESSCVRRLSVDGCDHDLMSAWSPAGFAPRPVAGLFARRTFPWGLWSRSRADERLPSANVSRSNTSSQIVLRAQSISRSDPALLSVVGPSGAGKSTFRRLILGRSGVAGRVLAGRRAVSRRARPDRASCSSAIRGFSNLSVSATCCRLRVRRQRPVDGATVGRPGAGDREMRSHIGPSGFPSIATNIERASGGMQQAACPIARRWRGGRASCCSTSRSAALASGTREQSMP